MPALSHRHQPFAPSEPALRLGCQLCLTDINLSLPQNPHYAWVASSVSQTSTFRSLRTRITLGLPALSHRHQPLAPQNLLNTRIATSVLQTSTFQCQSRKVSFCGCLADINLSAPIHYILLIFIGIYSNTHRATVLQTSTFQHQSRKVSFCGCLADINLSALSHCILLIYIFTQTLTVPLSCRRQPFSTRAEKYFLWLSCRHQPFDTNTLYLIDIYRYLLKHSPRHCLADVNLSAPEPKSIFCGCLADINLSALMHSILLIFINIYSGAHRATVLQTSTFQHQSRKVSFCGCLADINLSAPIHYILLIFINIYSDTHRATVLQTSTFRHQSRKVSLWLSCRHQPFGTNAFYLIDIY